jgi:hypothetical protein
MIKEEPEHARDNNCVKFFNLFASLPKWMLKSEFERKTASVHNQTRVEEQHLEDLLKIQSLAEGNDLTNHGYGALL